MSDFVVERVTLEVSVTCVGCARVLKEIQSLDGDAVRTGNTTQGARYWLDDMRKRCRAMVQHRGWQADDSKAGYLCAHCLAAKTDPIPQKPETSPDPKPHDDCA